MKQVINGWTVEDDEDLELEVRGKKSQFENYDNNNNDIIPIKNNEESIEDIISSNIPVVSSSNTISQPEVVVFNDTGVRSNVKKSKQDWKQFMSSKVSDINGKKKPAQKLTKAEIDQDKEDDMNDQELMNILETTKLVENYAAQELTGEEMRKYKKRKLVELGIKESKGPKAPFKQRLIMQQSAIHRKTKELEEAKNIGLYDPLIKNKWKLPTKSKDNNRLRGINGHIGTYKNGILTLSKEQISNANKMESSSKSYGRIQSTDNSIRRSSKSKGKKKGKGKRHH